MAWSWQSSSASAEVCARLFWCSHQLPGLNRFLKINKVPRKELTRKYYKTQKETKQHDPEKAEFLIKWVRPAKISATESSGIVDKIYSL